jgi:hypothetical protein
MLTHHHDHAAAPFDYSAEAELFAVGRHKLVLGAGSTAGSLKPATPYALPSRNCPRNCWRAPTSKSTKRDSTATRSGDCTIAPNIHWPADPRTAALNRVVTGTSLG